MRNPPDCPKDRSNIQTFKNASAGLLNPDITLLHENFSHLTCHRSRHIHFRTTPFRNNAIASTELARSLKLRIGGFIMHSSTSTRRSAVYWGTWLRVLWENHARTNGLKWQWQCMKKRGRHMEREMAKFTSLKYWYVHITDPCLAHCRL